MVKIDLLNSLSGIRGNIILDLNGDNYAEEGVPADIPAAFDWSDITKDEILEKAISRLTPGAPPD